MYLQFVSLSNTTNYYKINSNVTVNPQASGPGVYQILMKLKKFRNMKWYLSDSENTISYFRQILPSKYTIS